MEIFRISMSDVASFSGELHHHINGCPLYGRNAMEIGDTAEFSLCVPRKMGATSLELVFVGDKDGRALRLPFEWKKTEGEAFDVYDALCPPHMTEELFGLSFYHLEANTLYGKLLGFKDENKEGGVLFIPGEQGEGGRPWQLLIYKAEKNSPKWLHGSMIYHIFVDRFSRGKDTPQREDAVLLKDWENDLPEYPEYPGAPLRNNTFFGGNLSGIEQKLPYIASLGVGCIYLSPIFEAYSNHKYDTGDYMTVDAMFGGEEAFASLLSAAASYGIRIVLDGVFNHTGADSIYFNRFGRYKTVGAYQSPDSPYYSWYRFQEYPNRYTAWWDIPILPRIHHEEPSCREFFVGEEGVVAHYAKMGIGGFRLDVADELTDDFIRDIRRRLREHQPDAVLYGEVWEDASNKIAYGKRRAYYDGTVLDGVMNYPLRTGIISYLRYKDTAGLRYALCEVLSNCPKPAADLSMNFLGTHDTERVLTALAGAPRGDKTNAELSRLCMDAEEREVGIRRLKAAYTILSTLPGVPSIFYGDEAGLEGYGDPFNRKPFPWHNINDDILSAVQNLGKMRRSQPIYKQGEFSLLRLDGEGLAFIRFDKRTVCLTYMNNGDMPVEFAFSKPVSVLIGEGIRRRSVNVSGGEAVVLRLSKEALLEAEGQAGIFIPKDVKAFFIDDSSM